MFAVLKDFHPMLGIDLHIPWLIGTPAPAPAPVPYYVGMVLCGLTGTYQRAITHKSTWGTVVQKGSDIGPLIPHIGPLSYLLPLDILFSASKSYFGSSLSLAEGKPVAVAVLFVVNLNLNCGTPFPKRPGVVIAFNTHFVGMTIGDFIHGLLSAGIDWLLQYAIGKALGRFSDWLANKIAPSILSKAAAKAFLRQQGGVSNKVINQVARELAQRNQAQTARVLAMLPSFLQPRRELLNPIVNNTIGTVSGFLFGGPLGMDANGAFGWWTPGGSATSGAQDYLNNNVVDEFGHAPPPPPSQPPPPRSPPTIGPPTCGP